MLIGDFCTIDTLALQEGHVQTQLTWKPDHAIFQGHFPGQPVVPGVVMMQLVKEVLERALEHPLLLVSAGQLKFLQFIDPRQQPSVGLQVQYKPEPENLISVTASLQEGGVTFFKFVGRYRRS